jgi:oxygen-independent coproporphyrinogen-3 oxidase
MALGLYLSVPFCRTKCTFCNFASDVFSRTVFERYVNRVCLELKNAPQLAAQMGGSFDPVIDTIYLGGGTPTVLDAAQFKRLFVTIRQNFDIAPGAEITVECAPGTLNAPLLAAFEHAGVNRVSLGVQSFIDAEAAAVGRLHKRQTVFDDLAKLRSIGISNANIDLIAGLPHQTSESWARSLEETLATGAPHVSVYMLEVDEDSRLGKELTAGGTKYHAHFVPDEEATADFYLAAVQRLQAAGIEHYEISNFARSGFESRHNLKYWTRQPYLGFGVDAHSMLRSAAPALNAVRFSNPDALEAYIAMVAPVRCEVSISQAVEEAFFLGLRLTRGVDLEALTPEFGREAITVHTPAIHSCEQDGLLARQGSVIRLTPRGRLLSNDVFARFLSDAVPIDSNCTPAR